MRPANLMLKYSVFFSVKIYHLKHVGAAENPLKYAFSSCLLTMLLTTVYSSKQHSQ
jgi:hypothetical protein